MWCSWWAGKGENYKGRRYWKDGVLTLPVDPKRGWANSHDIWPCCPPWWEGSLSLGSRVGVGGEPQGPTGWSDWSFWLTIKGLFVLNTLNWTKKVYTIKVFLGPALVIGTWHINGLYHWFLVSPIIKLQEVLKELRPWAICPSILFMSGEPKGKLWKDTSFLQTQLERYHQNIWTLLSHLTSANQQLLTWCLCQGLW